MVLVANSTYTTITIQSDNLLDFSGIESVKLNAQVNCIGTYSDTIVEGDVDEEGLFTVDIATLFGSAPLADSVYSFTLVVTNDDDTISYEHACLFVDNTTKCLVADCVKNHQKLELQLDYFTLSRASGCTSCDCSTLCNIYNRLVNGLAECQDCD